MKDCYANEQSSDCGNCDLCRADHSASPIQVLVSMDRYFIFFGHDSLFTAIAALCQITIAIKLYT